MVQYNLFDAVRTGTREAGAAERETGSTAGQGAGGGGPALVRARLPAKPLFSVSLREPRAGNFGYAGPAAGMVRARLPAKPLISVSGREPRAGNFGYAGPAAGMCSFADGQAGRKVKRGRRRPRGRVLPLFFMLFYNLNPVINYFTFTFFPQFFLVNAFL